MGGEKAIMSRSARVLMEGWVRVPVTVSKSHLNEKPLYPREAFYSDIHNSSRTFTVNRV